MKTPTKIGSPRKHCRTPARSPGPCPYKGAKLQVPGEVFQQQESSSAEVQGWNNRRTDQLVVKFEDGTKYWFPLLDVLEWGDSELASASAAPPTSSSPAAADTSSTPRCRPRRAAAAATADNFEQQQQQQKAQSLSQCMQRQQQHAAGCAEVHNKAMLLVAAGVLLALLMMGAAVWLPSWPAYELEPSRDVAVVL